MTETLRGQDNRGDWALTAGFASLPSSAYQFNAISAGQLILPGRYIVRGAMLIDNNAGAAIVVLYDGQDTTGTIMGAVGAGAGLENAVTFGAHGVLTEIGCYINPSAGPVSGVVWAVPMWTYNITPPSQ